MPVITESKRLGDWLKWEQENQYSRDIVTVLAGSGADRALTSGTVLGCVTKGAATGAAVAGNTGNGTITTNPTVGQAAKPGVYQLVCIEPATNGGKFSVEDPDGILIGIATVGGAVRHPPHIHDCRRRSGLRRWGQLHHYGRRRFRQGEAN